MWNTMLKEYSRSKVQNYLKYEIDFGVVWISGEPQSVMFCDADKVERDFKDFLKNCFKITVPRVWPNGYITIEAKGKTLNATRFSYLKDHPEVFPELDELREVESFTEKQTRRVIRDQATPCIIYEDRRNVWSDANSLSKNPVKARKAFNLLADNFQNAGYLVEWVNENLFYIYSKQIPSWAISKVSLIN